MVLDQPDKLEIDIVESFLRFERSSVSRHEFVDGQIRAVPDDTLSHSRIYVNLVAEVGTQLKGRTCQALGSRMKVRTSSSSLFAYPDLTVVCGTPELHDSTTDVLLNPKAVFEILSTAARVYDRTPKFQPFRDGINSLVDHIYVFEDKPFVEHFTKRPDGESVYRSFNDMSDSFSIDSVECTLSLAEIYDRVEFEPLIEPEH